MYKGWSRRSHVTFSLIFALPACLQNFILRKIRFQELVLNCKPVRNLSRCRRNRIFFLSIGRLMNNIDYYNVDFPVKICTFKAKQIANTTCRVTKQRNFFLKPRLKFLNCPIWMSKLRKSSSCSCRKNSKTEIRTQLAYLKSQHPGPSSFIRFIPFHRPRLFPDNAFFVV